jgi:aminopeptidase N
MSLSKLAVCLIALMTLAACNRHGPAKAPSQGGPGIVTNGLPGAAIRLPDTVVPVRYDISVTPDAQAMKFSGHVDIMVEVKKPTREIVLNVLELSIDKAMLDGRYPAKVSVDTAAQRAAFGFDRNLAVGRHRLSIDYRGVINSYSAGLFALDYDTPQGKRKQLITQFESADARRFVPSWDEPNRKAIFQLSVTAPGDQFAVSNMPVQASQALAGGLKKTTFQPTPKMSSYLLFLGVGDLDRISQNVDGVDIGVVFRRGAQEKAKYALSAAAEILRYYNDYFGVKYPLPKLDLVAAPGAGGFGAMENWGAILYFENALLVDPQLSTEHDKQYVYLVIAHEMAHQWFGDLVTMDWWDDLWLNESFANWMEAKAIDHLHPDWEAFMIEADGKENAYDLDATAASHPVVQPSETMDQVNEIGDAITYDKGAAVIRMLEAYVGPDAWQKGVRAYIRDHAYGNAVRGELWKAIEAAAGKPVTPIARDFTEQAGVPLITLDKVDGSAAGVAATLRQGRFGLDEGSAEARQWQVPVQLASGASGAQTGALISGPQAQTVQVKGAAPVIVNAGQVGYYRSAYAEPLFQALLTKTPSLSPADQLGLVSDSWALGSGGYAPVSHFLQVAQKLPADADPLVWSRAANVFDEIDTLYEGLGARQEAFRAFARGVLEPVLARIGWDARPGEAATVAVLRERLLQALSDLDDAAVAAEARTRFDAFVADPASLAPGIRKPVLNIVGAHADAATFQKLRELAAKAVDPQEKRQYLEALAHARDPQLAQQAMLLTIGNEVPTSIAIPVMRVIAAYHPAEAWAFGQQHKAVFDARSDPSQKLSFIPRLIGSSADAGLADQLHAFAQKTYPEGGRRESNKVEAAVRFNAKVRNERLPEVDRWLAAQPKPVVVKAPAFKVNPAPARKPAAARPAHRAKQRARR